MPKINDLIQRVLPDDWTGVIQQLYDKQSNKFVLTDVSKGSKTWQKVETIFNKSSGGCRIKAIQIV